MLVGGMPAITEQMMLGDGGMELIGQCTPSRLIRLNMQEHLHALRGFLGIAVLSGQPTTQKTPASLALTRTKNE